MKRRSLVRIEIIIRRIQSTTHRRQRIKQQRGQNIRFCSESYRIASNTEALIDVQILPKLIAHFSLENMQFAITLSATVWFSWCVACVCVWVHVRMYECAWERDWAYHYIECAILMHLLHTDCCCCCCSWICLRNYDICSLFWCAVLGPTLLSQQTAPIERS